MIRIVTTSPPQTGIPYLGPVLFKAAEDMNPSKREKYMHKVIEAVIAEINMLSPNYTYIHLMPGHRDVRPFMWHDFLERCNYTYLVDLDPPLEEILAGFDKDARRLIRETGKKGLEFRESPDVDAFYEIMQKRYAEQGLAIPIISPQYLSDLLEAFPENLRMYSLRHGDEIISIVIVAIYHGKMIYWMGNPRISNGISGNEYLIWESILRAKAKGCKEFEINGAGERRLYQFKSKFNPRLEVCYVVYKKDRLGSMAEWAYANFVKKIRA
ncbi:GNAT family N-acetyltransferase [Methanocella arvoryzae]|uniref:BioF2-like acetyltransferase domain-containing protein n=1 Tax=Methanocella arvoryzae (strain DSM 22066 / NBRC 105507 / MRE50) TaxID=351160 RepID=Q0W0Z6_METAR|nr:GNAT family N-acetyltransferase [Methanocella arvoryzae]CAJ37947.1 hypothetical protein RRC201 [Methanocella arvoryzae MRE50]